MFKKGNVNACQNCFNCVQDLGAWIKNNLFKVNPLYDYLIFSNILSYYTSISPYSCATRQKISAANVLPSHLEVCLINIKYCFYTNVRVVDDQELIRDLSFHI